MEHLWRYFPKWNAYTSTGVLHNKPIVPPFRLLVQKVQIWVNSGFFYFEGLQNESVSIVFDTRPNHFCCKTGLLIRVFITVMFALIIVCEFGSQWLVFYGPFVQCAPTCTYVHTIFEAIWVHFANFAFCSVDYSCLSAVHLRIGVTIFLAHMTWTWTFKRFILG